MLVELAELADLIHVVEQRGGVDRSGHPKGPGERSSPYCLTDALGPGVDVRPSSREATAEIEREGPRALDIDRHDAHQVGDGRPFAAAHAGPHGTHATCRTTGRGRVYRLGHPWPSASPPAAVS